MIDNILNTVRQGVEKVQRRGEEMTQVARLKVEVYQLGRELEGHFARLGRAYHGGADQDLLESVREDIRRTEDEIRARERLISELGDDPGDEGRDGAQADRTPGAPAEAGRTSSASVVALPLDSAQTPSSPAPQPPSQSASQSDGARTDPPDAAGHSQATTPELHNRPTFTDQPGHGDDPTRPR